MPEVVDKTLKVKKLSLKSNKKSLKCEILQVQKLNRQY